MAHVMPRARTWAPPVRGSASRGSGVNVLFPCAGDSAAFPDSFMPFVIAAGQATFVELAARTFGEDARLVFAFRRDQEEAHDVSARLRHMFPGRSTCCVLEERTGGSLETVQAAVSALSLAGPFFVCDCDHSIDVTPMLRVKPWPTVLVPTWPLDDHLSTAWGKARLDACGRVLEVCEKEPMAGAGVVGRIGCYAFADIACLVAPGVPRKGDFSTALSYFVAQSSSGAGAADAASSPVVVQSVPIQRADFFGDVAALKDFQASRSTFFLDIDGTIVTHQSDRLLPGAAEKVREWRAAGHLVILTTARASVPPWLIEHDAVVASLGPGPRVLINDAKPQWPGGQTAQALTVPRNVGVAALELEDFARVVRRITSGASAASVTVMKRGSASLFVRKHTIGRSGIDVLRRQADDMERLAFLSPALLPRVLHRRETASEFWYDMEFLEGYDELWLSDEARVRSVVARVIADLERTVYCYAAPVDGAAWVAELLREKVLPRLTSPLANADTVTIDGVAYVGLRAAFARALPPGVVPTHRCPIHGDLTLENILYHPTTDDVKVIDPAGARHMDARELDTGKLFQSLLGKYEATKTLPVLVREVGPFAYELPAGPSHFDRSKVAFLGDASWAPGLFFMAVAFVRMVPYVEKVSPQRGKYALLLAIKALAELAKVGDGK